MSHADGSQRPGSSPSESSPAGRPGPSAAGAPQGSGGRPPHGAGRPGGPAAAHDAGAATESTRPEKGWHCSHLFYAFDRARLAALGPAALAAGKQAFAAALDPAAPGAPTRLQTWIVPGHKADFGVMALDPDPLVVDGVHQRLLAGPLGVTRQPDLQGEGPGLRRP